ncbi:MAG: hypothetical protein JSR45_05130 [Proteobacteria bacterium]|nr:hypothetical protein [Pseudomonadota bacterium]
MSTRVCLAAVAALLAVALSGCNLVVSEKPMFSAADARAAPVLRPGVWTSADSDCAFDPKAAISTWPQCANASIVTRTEIRSPTDASKTAPYLIVAGDPLVMQAKALLEGDIKANDGATELYFYLGFQPVDFDEQHRITAMRAWFVQCGPPPAEPPAPKPGEKPNPRAYATAKPLPGMAVQDTGMCTPTNGAAVLRAAGPSEAWGRPHLTARWVRDGDK